MLVVAASLLLAAAGCGPKAHSGFEPVALPNAEAAEPAVRAVIQRFQGGVRAAPADAEAHGRLGLAFAANGFWEEAHRSFHNAVELAPDNPAWRFHWGRALLESGDTVRGMEILSAAARALPQEPGVQLTLGVAQLDAGEPGAAETTLRAALSRTPKQVALQTELARARLDQGDAVSAEDLARGAVLADPSYGPARYVLGLALRDQGRDSEARDQLAVGLDSRRQELAIPYARELEDYSASQAAQNRRATALLSSGNTAAAVAIWQKVVDDHPEDGTMVANLAGALMQQGELERAQAAYERACKLDPGSFAAELGLSELHRRAGRLPASRQHAEQAVKLGPTVARTHQQLAKALAMMEQFPLAYDALIRAHRLDPQDPDILRGLGETCLRLSQPEQALSYYQKLIEVSPRDLVARVNAASLLLRLGRVDEGAAQVVELEGMAADHPRVKALREQLTRMGR